MNERTVADLPLAKIRILDLTQVMAGPFATMNLGDLGADIIKIEPPVGGDQARRGAGHFLTGPDTAGFLALNRNKRSVALDLKSQVGREAFLKLAESADVIVENFRPGVTARLGIDYPTISEANPKIIYASISGFGQYGPYADRPGFDLVAQAMSGIMSVTGHPDGAPVKCGIPVSDLAAGLFCMNAILAAYIERLATGRGQYIDTSLFEAALALSVWETTEFWSTGRLPRAHGSAHRLNAPYQAVKTADGYVVIAANNQRLWRRLCEAIDRPDLLTDDRFSDNLNRLEHAAELEEELEKTFGEMTTSYWVELLLEAGTPAAPINNYQQAVNDPHTKAREMVMTVDHPVEGAVKTIGPPVKFSRTPGTIRRPAPLLGEHTAEVLQEAGYSAADVAAVLAASEVMK